MCRRRLRSRKRVMFRAMRTSRGCKVKAVSLRWYIRRSNTSSLPCIGVEVKMRIRRDGLRITFGIMVGVRLRNYYHN